MAAATLGACLLTEEPAGLGAQMLKRRIEGKSWKEIADEFSLGSPSTARAKFAKLTGIKDFKTKGNALKQMVQNMDGLVTGQNKAAATAVKHVDDAVKPDIPVDAPGTWSKNKIDKYVDIYKNDINDVYPGQGDIVLQNLKDKHGYQMINHYTGVPIKDIDQLGWQMAWSKADGHVWNAYKTKPTSEFGFKAVIDLVADQRKLGKTIQQVVQDTDIPDSVVRAILKGEWKTPSPGSFQPYIPPSPPQTTVMTGAPPGKGVFQHRPARDYDRWHVSLGNDLSETELAAVRSYTGSGYHDINANLRGGRASSSKAAAIDRAMRPLPFDATVTRWTGHEGFMQAFGIDSAKDIHKHVGAMWTDPAFFSTNISAEGIFGGRTVKLVMELPQGTPARWVNPISLHKGENELLVGRGTSFMITKVKDINSYTVEVTVRAIL